jgi:hypothetical protein
MRDFAGPDLQKHYLLIAKNATYIKKTKYVQGTLAFSNTAIRVELPFHSTLAQLTGHDFPRVKLVPVDSVQAHGSTANEYRVFRPELAFKNGSVPMFSGTKPKTLAVQHNQLNQALAQYQKNQLISLQKNHVAEKQTPPDNETAAQLSIQHTAELQAQQQQQQREQRLVQSEQQRQTHVVTAPRAPAHQQHYVLPVSPKNGGEPLPLEGQEKN